MEVQPRQTGPVVGRLEAVAIEALGVEGVVVANLERERGIYCVFAAFASAAARTPAGTES